MRTTAQVLAVVRSQSSTTEVFGTLNAHFAATVMGTVTTALRPAESTTETLRL